MTDRATPLGHLCVRFVSDILIYLHLQEQVVRTQILLLLSAKIFWIEEIKAKFRFVK